MSRRPSTRSRVGSYRIPQDNCNRRTTRNYENDSFHTQQPYQYQDQEQQYQHSNPNSFVHTEERLNQSLVFDFFGIAATQRSNNYFQQYQQYAQPGGQHSSSNNRGPMPDLRGFFDSLQQPYKDVSSKETRNGPEIYAAVRLEPLPFEEIIRTIVRPTTLFARKQGGNEELAVDFELRSDSQSLINKSDCKVYVRFCPVNKKGQQTDCFPSGLRLKVNSSICPVPYIFASDGSPKYGYPIDITNLCLPSPFVSNTIKVSWYPELSVCYCISIFLVKEVDSESIVTELKKTSTQEKSVTKALIKGKFTEDSDVDIATTSLRVSLNCPVTKSRIITPCRAKTCFHLQCFDALTYLNMNRSKPKWICPVCDNHSPFSSLIIDQYFCTLLEDKDTKSQSEVKLFDDGRWGLSGQSRGKSTSEESRQTSGNDSFNLSFVEDMASLIIVSDDDSVIILDDTI